LSGPRIWSKKKKMEISSDENFWAELDEEKCPCQGTGWAEAIHEMVQCPLHFKGQLHPETQALLFDEPKRLKEEERKSLISFQIEKTKEKIAELEAELRQQRYQLHMLELDLINRTPTVKMKVVIPPAGRPSKPLELDLGELCETNESSPSKKP
jgi:hypothetical protein